MTDRSPIAVHSCWPVMKLPLITFNPWRVHTEPSRTSTTPTTTDTHLFMTKSYHVRMTKPPIRDVQIADDMIRLGQFLKLAGLAEDGSHAKELIDADEVMVNGRLETRRGAQLHDGDVVAVGDERARLHAAG